MTDLVLGARVDVLRAATYGRGVFEFTRPDWPVIAVDPEDGLDFGTTCEGPSTSTLEVFNVGAADLVISSVQRLMGSAGFEILPNPGTPLVLAPGRGDRLHRPFHRDDPGHPETATIRIVSNDPGAPVVDLLATGIGGTRRAGDRRSPTTATSARSASASSRIATSSSDNRGPCKLEVYGISSSDPAFVVPGVQTYPLVVAPGDGDRGPHPLPAGGTGTRRGDADDHQQRSVEPRVGRRPRRRPASSSGRLDRGHGRLRRNLPRVVPRSHAHAVERRALPAHRSATSPPRPATSWSPRRSPTRRSSPPAATSS